MRSELPSLGFAGIGLMGLPMCRRLLAAGFPLTVWNRSPETCAELVAAGARLAASPAELCRDNDMVLLCLADTAVVREVVFGEHGIAMGGRSGQLLVDFSSLQYISSAGLRSILLAAKKLKSKGGRFALCSLSAAIKEVFDVSGFSSILDIHAGQDQGVAALK